MRKITLLAVLLTTACSLNPDLSKPEAPVPASFAGALEAEGQSAAALPWREVFTEPRLQKLIELSLESNRDLRIALLNVEAVRAQYNIQRSNQLPSIDANAGYTKQKAAVSGTEETEQFEQYTANAALASFEIDLFGRLRSQSEAAFSRYLASEEGANAARITLIGAVVDAYLNERLASEQLTLTEITLQDWRASLDIANKLKEAAQSSGLEVEQAVGLVRQAESDLEGRKRILSQAQNAIGLLIGNAPVSADTPASSTFAELKIATQLQAGLTSDLLVNRPDIKQAEHELVASNADIGAARAAFFPRISLTAALGFASPELSGLFSSDTQTWSFAPQIVMPIFQGGRLKGELDLANIRKEIEIQEYEKAIQTAFREVSDGLAARATYWRQIEAQQGVVTSANRRVDLTKLRYEAGIDDRLELLDAQRSLYSSQQNLLDLKRDEYSSAAALYRALGGGSH